MAKKRPAIVIIYPPGQAVYHRPLTKPEIKAIRALKKRKRNEHDHPHQAAV